MRQSLSLRVGACLGIGLILAGCGQSEPAANCGGLRVSDAWVAPAHTGSREMLGYFSLHNTGTQPVKIQGAASDAFDRAVFQNKAAAAQSSDDAHGGAQPLAPFTIAPSQAMSFKPGQREVALYSPSRAYRAGDTIRLTLICGSQGATLATRATVRDRNHDLPAPSDDETAANRRQVIEDGRDGGGPDAAADSKTAG